MCSSDLGLVVELVVGVHDAAQVHPAHLLCGALGLQVAQQAVQDATHMTLILQVVHVLWRGGVGKRGGWKEEERVGGGDRVNRKRGGQREGRRIRGRRERRVRGRRDRRVRGSEAGRLGHEFLVL